MVGNPRHIRCRNIANGRIPYLWKAAIIAIYPDFIQVKTGYRPHHRTANMTRPVKIKGGFCPLYRHL